jgi:hypothetical protein
MFVWVAGSWEKMLRLIVNPAIKMHFYCFIFPMRWDCVHLVLQPLFGLLYQPQIIDDDCGAISGMRIGRENRTTRRKTAPVPLCPPQIPHDLTRARTRVVAVGSRRLTVWAIPRPAIKIQRPALNANRKFSISFRLVVMTIHNLFFAHCFYNNENKPFLNYRLEIKIYNLLKRKEREKGNGSKTTIKSKFFSRKIRK